MASLAKPDALLLAGPSLIVLIIGLGIVTNGLLFTVPKTLQNNRRSKKQTQDLFAGPPSNFVQTPGDLPSARPSFLPAPVTEHTTRHLSNELVETPRRNNG
jgi:hypothetical protein